MSFEQIFIPQLAINGYLWWAMNQLEPTLSNDYPETIPIYPLGDSSSGDEPWDNKPYLIYDRVLRFSTSPCYVKKRDSSLYYLKAREIDSLQWSAAIQTILDREDDVAKDINSWIRSQADFAEYPVYFHSLRVYQARSSSASSSGSLRENSTVQPYYITEFMVDSIYHFTKELKNIPRTPSTREEDGEIVPWDSSGVDGDPTARDASGNFVWVNGLRQYDLIYDVPDEEDPYSSS
jgi:hypothetical protein